MGFKRFDWYSWGLVTGFSLVVSFLFFSFQGVGSSVWLIGGYSVEYGGVFVFDVISFYLCFLSGFLFFSLCCVFGSMSRVSLFFVSLSVFSSFLCYCCVDGFWFWFFYEASILFLLLLLVLESPYSERFVATWYLFGYVVFTSLPMLLLIFYLSSLFGTFDLQLWSFFGLVTDSSKVFLAILLVLFVTKIPLFPFHVWLPIVHAEASSPVSVCLSGYVMKLGLLGVVRFGSFILSDLVFSLDYVLVCFGFSIVFLFCASRELDSKRWLAFMSLSHIVIAVICLSTCDYDKVFVAYWFCLGHGLSAGVMFIVLWFLYEVSGTRNWLLLKDAVSSSFLIRFIVLASICLVASVPPSLQFFSEVLALCSSSLVSLSYVFLFFLYLFVGGLVPLFVIGSLVSRHYNISYGKCVGFSFVMSCVFLIVWSFFLFLIF
uniref:NADH-ubiquinone oxidoreductase chain 4 n=1 Tax=Uvitellina sp. SSS-2019 TaxID=2587434 RepID=A0A4Y5RDJ9_9TREM|nr:NADH dehydrogenase subunit 4 [Uvitellina sp. SSS-2019]QCY72814.1 NADH dehydrogenase subunit 4 [Uvitellina sp. SSS-2019]